MAARVREIVPLSNGAALAGDAGAAASSDLARPAVEQAATAVRCRAALGALLSARERHAATAAGAALVRDARATARIGSGAGATL